MNGTVFKKKLNRSIGGNVALFIFLILVAVFTSFPLFYAISNAFKPLEEIYIFPPRLFIKHPTIENFVMFFEITKYVSSWVPFSRYVFNTILVCVTATGGHVILASMAAYPLAKHKFPGRNMIEQIIVVSLMFTTACISVPQYIVFAKLHLTDTYFAYIFPVLYFTLGLYLMKNFMTQIPNEMLEAARVDGASEMKIFWSIVMPCVKPAWVTLIILSFQQVWNDPKTTYIYSEQMKVLTTLLSSISGGSGGIAFAGVAAAAAFIVLLPPMIIFICSQNMVIETMTTSGLK